MPVVTVYDTDSGQPIETCRVDIDANEHHEAPEHVPTKAELATAAIQKSDYQSRQLVTAMRVIGLVRTRYPDLQWDFTTFELDNARMAAIVPDARGNSHVTFADLVKP